MSKQDKWAWKEISFRKWRNVVDRRHKSVYLVTINDAGIDNEMLASHWQAKKSPYEFVEWFSIKYDLEPKYTFGL